MNDLINRQAAIDALTEYGNGRAVYISVKEAVRRIESLPSAQQEQQWIPLSERTPDMDERVLVYTVAHEYHIWDCMSNRGESYFWEDEEGLYHNKYEVDLWMSIPDIQER